jgi:TetR/AcrR family transcriptional repressor of nem operon
MPKASSAARLFREHGLHGVSIPEIMGDASLTHGGFYRNFDSKDELAGEACARAFDELDAMTVDIADRHVGDGAGGWREFVETYLSPSHRDDRGTGCPAAGLCADVAREAPKSRVRGAYISGVQRVVRRLSHFLHVGSRAEGRDDTLAKYATLVGAMVLSRATRGQPISDEILAAARRTLLR